MPDQVPGLLKAVQILEQDKVVGNPGGRVLTKGISNTSPAQNVELSGFTPQSGIGRDKGGFFEPVPLGAPYSPYTSNTATVPIWAGHEENEPLKNQGFLARVVCEAIDKELPEMAEVGDGVLIYLLNRYAGYD